MLSFRDIQASLSLYSLDHEVPMTLQCESTLLEHLLLDCSFHL